MLAREPYVRVEEGTHSFSNAFTTTSFNSSIGSPIIAAVGEAREKLRVMTGGVVAGAVGGG
jgi:hypothetical protein